jgi:hypothetical protein
MNPLMAWAIGVIFGAGVCYAQLRRLEREILGKASLHDLNNIGRRLNETADDHSRRARNIEFALLSVCEPGLRAEIAAMLKGQ